MSKDNAKPQDYHAMTDVELNKAVAELVPDRFEYMGWADDLNNAYRLIEDTIPTGTAVIAESPSSNGLLWSVRIGQDFHGEDDVLARAIVIAWLYWKEATNE